MSYLDKNGTYYEGDKQYGDADVPKRPSANHEYLNGEWVLKIPTPQEQSTAIANAIQKMLDDKAISLRYDSMLSARSYAGYTNPFQTEALRLATWAAACWLEAGAIEAGAIEAGAIEAGAIEAGAIEAGAIEAGAIEAEVMAGAPMPTVAEAMARMPGY